MGLRQSERASIIDFLTRESGRFDGQRVLDYGCGAMPYREIIESAGGIYRGYDAAELPGFVAGADESVAWHPGDYCDFSVIVCNQVIQFLEHTRAFLIVIRSILDDSGGGTLLMTGPTNWPIVEPYDLYRFTAEGIRRLLTTCGFGDVETGYRDSIIIPMDGHDDMPTGWWAIAETSVA